VFLAILALYVEDHVKPGRETLAGEPQKIANSDVAAQRPGSSLGTYTRRHVELKFRSLVGTLPGGSSFAALHASKLVFAGSFSLGFPLTKIAGRFTSRRLCGRLRFFLGASTTKETAD